MAYKAHRVFKQPEEPFGLLWRYMDFPKFFWLMKTHKLFFPSVHTLRQADRFENSLPKKELIIHKAELGQKLESIRASHEEWSHRFFTSCWHYNKTESIAMWKLYAPTGFGIAIQTTVPEFRGSFDHVTDDVFAGLVQYIDYETERFYENDPEGYEYLNSLVAIVHKKDTLEHEHEFRAVIGRADVTKPHPEGIEVPISLQSLVQRVVVSPQAPNWFADAVFALGNEHIPGTPICHSIDDVTPTL
jgi:hypothetical protein